MVLEITMDDAGRATAVSVYRSNGYAHLEERAARALLDGAPSVTFLAVRSLVPNEKLF